MMKRPGLAAMLAAALVSGCSDRFQWEEATEAERREFLETATRDLRAGIERQLPKYEKGIELEMGDLEIDTDTRLVGVTVIARLPGPPPDSVEPAPADEILEKVCPARFLGTVLDKEDVVVTMRIDLEGYGNVLFAELSRNTCAPYAAA